MQQQQFSSVTKTYLCRFYEILDEMIDGMTNAKLTDSISHNFIVQMIPHHAAAIEMSHNLLQYTTLVPLQNIASDIIVEQTKSIENMQNILDCCSKQRNTRCDVHLYQRNVHRITQMMFFQMQNARSTNNINANFMREMIPHHQGAIRMSKNALHFDICPELIPILQAIISSQENGVQEMERLLKKISRGCERE